jgi:small subunit ribosomal protein S6
MSLEAARTKEYETIYILRPDVDADTAEKVQTRVAEVIDKAPGKIVKVEGWGRRRLAYPVGKQRRGVYVYVKYLGGGGLVQEIERNLKLSDVVMKFQTVLLREHVDVSTITIDPEEVKLGRLELPAEEEKEETREKLLGLVEGAFEPKAPRGDEDEYGDEDDNWGAPASTAEPPSSKPAPKKDGDEGGES